jgi:hypothetical protein
MTPDPHPQKRQHHAAAPGWKWHRDWRIWVMAILMLGAIIIYVLTLDLR